MGGSTGYSTENEIQFLSGLGKYCLASNGKPAFDKLELLKGYLQSMRFRTEWGWINKLRVEQEVIALIEREVILNA